MRNSFYLALYITAAILSATDGYKYLSDRDYSKAFKILAENSPHQEVIVQEILKRIRPGDSYLEIGPGDGKIARNIAPLFKKATYVEPNALFAAELEGTVYHSTWEEVEIDEEFDLAVCSHVLYHVPTCAWKEFIGKIAERSKMTVVVMECAGSQLNKLLCRYNP
ncbi:MAG: methyltransferase domain-containing protein, partial [Chlamydiia bacterium]|nr:methyltransferase domain-containing protein [Chlamydiia bacterium]